MPHQCPGPSRLAWADDRSGFSPSYDCLEALTDRSRRPVRYANQLPQQIESLIVAAKRDKPHWGARKIRELLVRRLDGDIRVPAKSTIHRGHWHARRLNSSSQPTHRWRETDSNLYGAFPVKRLFWVVLTVFCSERERPFFVPSPAIRFPERAEGVKGPKC